MTRPAPTREQSLHGEPAGFAGGFVDVATDTCAWLQPNGDWSESNAGLVIGDGAAALIDTAFDLPLTRRILGGAARRTAEPIRTLLLTHGDGDHSYGCQLLPAAEMIASEATRDDMAHENPAGLARSRAGARLLSKIAIGPPRQFGRYITWMLDPFDFSGIELRAPDRTFARSLAVEVGGRELRLQHLGPAHTAGDTIVHAPDASTVFAGDLLFVGVTPNTWAGEIGNWRRALEVIVALEPQVVVPGHGPVSDLDGIAEFDRYWAWLEAAATPLLAAGRSVGETALELVLGDDFRTEPWGSWVCPERTVCNVISIDRARRGVPTLITHAERPKVMWKVAALARRIEAAER